jgi:hypothetical protein
VVVLTCFCNIYMCVCVWVCVGVVRVLVLAIRVLVFTVFVLSVLCFCIVSFMYTSYLFCLYCHRVTTQLQLIIIITTIIIC